MNDARRAPDEPARSGAGRPRGAAEGRRARARLLLGLLLTVMVALAGAALLLVLRQRREAGDRARLARSATQGPRVLVARVESPPAARTWTFPGDVRAFEQATVFAKVNGYVAEMRVDKGDQVRRGQVLARIESPETDHQVQAARAALDVARRNADRARRLAPRVIVSEQELDQANAVLRSAQAEYERVRSLQAYEVVRAPFDGRVTARYVDPGALLSATASGQPVVDLASEGRVRVLVYVGQDVAPFVRLGDEGVVTLDQQPGAQAAAHVRRLADALDPRTRTMLVELWPDGAAGLRLVPGLFVHVALRVAVPPLPVVPAEALVSRGERLQVALVRGDRLRFVDVEPGLDDGRVVQIRRGLQVGDVVALSTPSDLADGAPVQPVARGKPPPAGGAGSAPRQGRAPTAR